MEISKTLLQFQCVCVPFLLIQMANPKQADTTFEGLNLLVGVSGGKYTAQAEVTVRVGCVVTQTEAERTVPEQPSPPAVHLADSMA